MRGSILLPILNRAATTALGVWQVLHRVDVAASDATRWKTSWRFLILLQMTFKVFVLDLVIQVWNRRVVVNTLPRWLTIDERVAIRHVFISKRLGDAG